MSKLGQFRQQKKTNASTLQGHPYQSISSDVATKSTVAVETYTGANFNLTTTAGQTVIIWLKGDVEFVKSGTNYYVEMTYSGSRVDVVNFYADSSNDKVPFALMWTSSPGADTQTVQVNTDANKADNLVWIVLKIN